VGEKNRKVEKEGEKGGREGVKQKERVEKERISEKERKRDRER
jgi:hypothetical protein